MTDVSMNLTTAQAAEFLSRLQALRPIYEETQLTGYNPLTTPHAITVVGNEFRKRSADGLTTARWTPRGVSLSSLVWTDPNMILDALELEPMFDDIDVIRVPIHESHWNSTSYTKQEFMDDYIDPIIQRIKGYGKHPSLDCHPVSNYTAETMAWVFDFWENLAPVYRNDARVIYEAFNEPIGNGLGGGTDSSLETWLAYKIVVQPLIDYIRKKAPSSHVIVGSPSWTTRISHADTHPFTGGNLSYSFHNYPNYGATYGKQLQELLESDIPYASIPVWHTEWGYDSTSLDGDVVNLYRNTYYPEVMERMLLDHPNAGWIAWNYDTESRPPMMQPEGAAMLAQVTSMLAAPVDYTPLDTPFTIADYINVPDTLIAWDFMRSTITEVSGEVSTVAPIIGTGNLSQTDVGRRITLAPTGINGQQAGYFSGGYAANYLSVPDAATLLNGKNLLTFAVLCRPEAGNVGNAPIFSFTNGTISTSTTVRLTMGSNGKPELYVKGGGTERYMSSGTNPILNGVDTLILVTVDFATQRATMEYDGQAMIVNSGFGSTAFTGSTTGVIGASDDGSIGFKGHIGFVQIIEDIYEYRYKKALINYIMANR